MKPREDNPRVVAGHYERRPLLRLLRNDRRMPHVRVPENYGRRTHVMLPENLVLRHSHVRMTENYVGRIHVILTENFVRRLHVKVAGKLSEESPREWMSLVTIPASPMTGTHVVLFTNLITIRD